MEEIKPRIDNGVPVCTATECAKWVDCEGGACAHGICLPAVRDAQAEIDRLKAQVSTLKLELAKGCSPLATDLTAREVSSERTEADRDFH